MSAGDWITLVGAVAALVAAVYAVRAFNATTSATRAANAQRRRDVQPRVSFHPEWFGGWITLGNAGGAVVDGCAVANLNAVIHEATFRIGEHIAGLQAQLAQIGHGKPGQPSVVGAVGQDTDGGWWDLLTNQPLSEPPPGRPGEPDFRRWIVQRAGFEYAPF